MKIQGTVALVTGANRGLGKALVEAFLEAGASKVYAAARDPSRIAVMDRVVPIRLDVTSLADIQAAAANHMDVSVLVNNAGISIRSANILDPGSLSSFRQELETNVLGPLALTQAFAPVLASNGGGAVVNILSALSWASITGVETYSATKSAAWSLTNGLRHVLGQQGTQVVAVHVGFMDTDMTRGLHMAKASPVDVARATLESVAKGELEVLADATSAKLKRGLAAGIYLSPLPRG